jgi:hypothetical protein
MKKSIVTIGLFSLMMILTSFATSENVDITGLGSAGNRKVDITGLGSAGNRKVDITGLGSAGNRKVD